MRITAISGTVELVLGDDDRAVGAQIHGYTGDTPSRIQQRTPDMASYPAPIFRGFGQPYRSWTTERIHADAATAFVFGEQHGDQVPGTCILKIEDRGAEIVFDAIRETARLVESNGVATTFQYKFLLLGPARTELNAV